MSEHDRKKAGRPAGRASRRGRVLRRGRKKHEADARQARNPDPRPAGASTGGEESQLGDPGKVSSLLETTGKEVRQLLEAADDAAVKIREAAETEKISDAGKSKGDEVSSLVSRINREARQVLESADEAAEKIREEARAEARHLIDQSRRQAEAVTSEQIDRVSEVTEQLLGELQGMQRQLDTLRGAFDHAIRAMGADLGVEPSDVWSTHRNGPEAEQESRELRERLGSRPRRKGIQEPEGISEGARLLAMQQMMAGVDADVIERRLKEEFGIEDPKPVLEWMGLQAGKPQKTEKSKKR